MPFRIHFCPSAKTFVIRFSTWAFSTTFSSENPPHGRSIRISHSYAHILLMNSFSTCKNGRNPLYLADYAHPVGFYDSISGFTPKSIISSKCISHPGNYQYFFQMYQPSHKLSIISPTSAIPETINNSSEIHQQSPLRNRILHALYILKHRLCSLASVLCDDLHDRTSDDNAVCGGSHLLCLLRR